MNINESGADNKIFPKGERAPAEYFTGTAWIKPLVAKDDIFNCVIGNVTFEPGARNNWHIHPGGQVLIATDGIGYFQEKGKPIQLFKKGDVIQIPPNIIHWHGASPDREFTHIAISTNTQKGVVDWMERVTDDEYNGFK